jgi:hypothetical protein
VSKKTPLIKVDPPNYEELLQMMIAQHNEAYLQQQQQQTLVGATDELKQT